MKIQFFYGRVKLSELQEQFGKDFQKDIKEKRLKPFKGVPDLGSLHSFVPGKGFFVSENGTINFIKEEPYNKGGAVTCIIVDDNNNNYIGNSICSMQDNFSYRLGRKIAYGRAKAKMSGG